MSFDWQAFFERRGIEYRQSSRGNLEVHCPWCGSADQGMHLSVSLDGRGYRCWRAPTEHYGRAPARLVQILLGCTWGEALAVAGVQSNGGLYGEDELRAVMGRLQNTPHKPAFDEKNLGLPSEFKPLTRSAPALYVDYMLSRGYSISDIDKLTERYGLYYAAHGPFAYRVIFPIMLNNKLVNWTGRSVAGNARLRYKTLTTDLATAAASDTPVAALPVSETLWNYDNAMRGADQLWICEGPFDAMRVDYFGADYGARAVCVFTKSISDAQVGLLEILRESSRGLCLLFDSDARLGLLRVGEALAHLDVRFAQMPHSIKDPAEMTQSEVINLLRTTRMYDKW